MAFNDLLKIDLPDVFPTHDYSEFMAAAIAVLLSDKTEAWKEFAGARLEIALRSHSRADTLVSALSTMCNSREWGLWVDLRNRMTHRSNLPRIISASFGSTPPPAATPQFAATSSTPELEADESHLEAMFLWLSESLSQLLKGGRDLAIVPKQHH